MGSDAENSRMENNKYLNLSNIGLPNLWKVNLTFSNNDVMIQMESELSMKGGRV